MELEDKKKSLITHLKREGYLKTRQVEKAMMEVSRELFVRPEDRPHAYADQPLVIGSGQTISAPHMVAIMTELLEPGKSDTILEVGGGSGYQAAVLSRLVRKVYSVELVPELVSRARVNLKKSGFGNVEVREGDGSLGRPEHAPFDKIIITCGTDKIYPAWKEQLKEDGILLAPVNAGHFQELILARKKGNDLKEKKVLNCSFVPLRH